MIIPDHILLGTAVAQVSASKDRAAWLSILFLSIFPDADIILGLPGTAAYLNNHRIYTHNIFFGIIVSLLLTILFFRKSRFSFPRFFALCMSAFLGHVFLDCLNAFGTKVFFPLSHIRVAFSFLFEFDIIFSLLLYGAVGIIFFMKEPPLFRKLGLLSLCLVYALIVVPFFKNKQIDRYDSQFRKASGHSGYISRECYPWFWQHWRAVYELDKQYCLIEKNIDNTYSKRSDSNFDFESTPDTTDKNKEYRVEFYDKYPPSYDEIRELEVVKAYHRYTDSAAFREKNKKIEMFSMRYPETVYKVTLERVNGSWKFTDMTGASARD
ncbi:MAG: metal-dependent hydrolase [bacterium]|nr:metal-dependent hydrolase [bacterium]